MILNKLNDLRSTGKKAMAVLIDPDKIGDSDQLDHLIDLAVECCVSYFFIGGSLIVNDNMAHVIARIKSRCSIPAVLFPGNNLQIDASADGILFLSLISGRNPELLIGQQVIAAPVLKNSSLEVLSTGYILINGGKESAVSYMSNTTPIPADKYAVAACTALAGTMMGMSLIYMDAGSGAKNPIVPKMVSSVKKSIDVPLIIGGGINTAGKALDAIKAGADVVVIGNAIEKNPNLMIGVSESIYNYNLSLNIH